jgi:hypothetical protein
MAVCARCKTELNDDAIFCTECGAPVIENGEGGSESARIETLVAAANVQRTHGDYEAAVGQCTEILKQDPENPAVHCLLGDIYADQNKVEQAVRWYQMACEIDPESKGCAERLDRLRTKLADMNAVESADGPNSWFDRFVIGENFESSIRIITFASAGFAALLIGFGLVALFSQKQPSVSASNSYPPSQNAPYPRGRKPLVVAPTGVGPGAPIRTAYEDQLLYRIASSRPVVSRGVAVSGLRLDPRTHSLTVTYTNASNSVDRRETLLSGAVVASAGFAASKDIASVTLRCLANAPDTAGGTAAAIIFIADVPRQSAVVLQPNAAPEQISRAMQNPWWSTSAR